MLGRAQVAAAAPALDPLRGEPERYQVVVPDQPLLGVGDVADSTTVADISTAVIWRSHSDLHLARVGHARSIVESATCTTSPRAPVCRPKPPAPRFGTELLHY